MFSDTTRKDEKIDGKEEDEERRSELLTGNNTQIKHKELLTAYETVRVLDTTDVTEPDGQTEHVSVQLSYLSLTSAEPPTTSSSSPEHTNPRFLSQFVRRYVNVPANYKPDSARRHSAKLT